MTRGRMPVVYIASPYTVGDTAANVALQIEAAHRLMDMGLCPIAPLLSHFLHIHKQRPYQDWIRIDDELVLRSDIVLRLGGESPGANREVQLARANGILVAYSWEQLDEVVEIMREEG